MKKETGADLFKRASKYHTPVPIFVFVAATCLFLSSCFPAWAAPAETKKTAAQTNKAYNAAGQEGPDIMNVYGAVPPEKSLLASPRFLLIDDFNGKGWKNKLGGIWRLENAKAGQVALERVREDARNPRSGYSLKAAFDLAAQQQFTLESSLEKLDMSQGQYLAVKCRTIPVAGGGKFSGKIRIGLMDWAGKTITQDISGPCTEPKSWGEAILPLKLFKGLDLDQLSKIFITVSVAKDRRSQAAFWVDELVFFGRNDVGFESTLDNLRGFPKVVLDYPAKKELLATSSDKEFLRKIGHSTWRYFEAAVNKESGLVLDHIKVGDFPLAGMYTSPTNIAMQLMGAVAARELGYITKEDAKKHVVEALSGLRKLRRWKGFFFNFYETTRLGPSREFVSSVDNAWLAAALIVVRQAFPGTVAKEATQILDGMNFHEFYDPDTNHIAIGYDGERGSFTPYHYGMLVTEARIISFIGIGKGDLPREHWWYLYRTAPSTWDWQTQKPQGKPSKQDGVDYFQGYYTDGGKKFVPGWGGSLFEFLMPTLVIPEQDLAPKGLGLNDRIATELHRDYALKEKNYPVWGISPCAIANGRRWQYNEYGIRKLGVKGYPEKGVIAPYASFLALETLPKDAVRNIRKLLEYDIYGEYGFYDSLNLRHGFVTHQYLTLDQGMSLLAIANHLEKGVIQKYFMKDPIAKKAKPLLGEEHFF